ncbi:MAG: histidine kinase [Saprospiraceae bacterium]|nr:histidine kinase [Saprospiraceae bacterium]
MKRLIKFWCFTFWCCTSICQSPAYRQFTDDDGLPSMTLYGILQDPKGFLWIATPKGICRFDGREFKRYGIRGMKSQDTPFSFMDNEGIPWFYNMAGDVFYVRNDSLHYLDLHGIKPIGEIYSFYVKNPFIYISWTKTDSPQSIKYNLFDLNQKQILERNYVFLGLKDGALIGYDYEKRKRSFDLYAIDSNELIASQKILNQHEVKFIHEIDRYMVHSDNYSIIIASNYIWILDSCNQILSSQYFPDITNNKIDYINFINENELFIGTNESSYLYDLKDKELKSISHYTLYMNTVIEDCHHRKWISTTDHGLLLDLNNGSMVYTSDKSDIASDEAYVIQPIHNQIFVGHHNGKLSIFNNDLKLRKIEYKGLGRVRFIQEIEKWNTILGFDVGLQIIEKANTRHIPCADLNIGSIKAGIHINEHQLFLCTSLGVYNIPYSKLYQPQVDDLEKYRELDVRSLCISEFKGVLYAGTVNGLYKRSKSNGWEKIGNTEVFIKQLYNSNDSILMLCTDGQGLYLFDGTEIMDSINTQSGLPSDNVSSICTINPNQFAIGTDQGVYMLNKNTRLGYNLDVIDGLPGNEINDLKCHNNLLWIGTSKGLFTIPIENINPNQEIPYIEIQDAKLFSREGQSKFKSPLAYNQNHLKFVVQSRSLISGGSMNLYYRFANRDSQWLSTPSQVVEFVGLGAGKYNLQFKSVNEDKIDSNIIEQTFEILPPWYKSIWFSLIMVLSLSSFSVSLSYWRQRKKRIELEKKRMFEDQLNQLKEEALQNQMNPHFMFNALNAIQGFLSNNDHFNAMNYLSKFGRLIRMIFDQSREKRISLETELAFLRNYLELERLRFKEKVDIQLFVDPAVEEKATELFLPPLVIQPIVENAFKHGLLHKGSEGYLKIKLEMTDGQLVCTVEDNGIGRESSSGINRWKKNGRKSTGIATIRERLAIIDRGRQKIGLQIRDLYDASGQSAGTQVTINL